MPADSHYVARQPIVDASGKIVAYELLFRSPGEPARDGSFATASVVVKTFADYQLTEVLGEHPGFVNIDSAFLMSDLLELLPPRRAVLELLEDTVYTPDIVARCKELKDKGYTLAADDYCGERATLEPAAHLLDIIKVDLMQLGRQDMAAMTQHFPGKRMLAEKVETAYEFGRCADAGYQLFQGYFFARPVPVGKTRSDPGRLAAIDLLAQVMGGASDAEINQQIKRQPSLGIGLLRLVNSAGAGLSKPISSFKQALYTLGRKQLERWLQMLVYLGDAPGDPGDEPMLQLAAVRGKTMESLALAMEQGGERAFLCGLVSLFDVALGMSRLDVVRRLSLDAEIQAALLQGKGTLGALLALAEAMEIGRDDAVVKALARLPTLPRDRLLQASTEAMRWASAVGTPA